jgi:hypothetical protein
MSEHDSVWWAARVDFVARLASLFTGIGFVVWVLYSLMSNSSAPVFSSVGITIILLFVVSLISLFLTDRWWKTIRPR